MKRILSVLLCLILIFSVASACSKKVEETTAATTEATTAATTEATTEATTAATTEAGLTNPLTGLPCDKDYSGIRPYCSMVNNIEVATPQSGVSQADIFYEILAEGGITRNMAVFQDIYDVGVLGSTRSARPYFVDVADSYDSIYIHAGGSEGGYNEISATGIQDIDGVNGHTDIFYRDQWRMDNEGYEHSLMVDTSLIHDYETKYDLDVNHESGYKCNLVFTDDGTPKKGEAASNIDVHFTYKDTSFEYNTADKVYEAFEYGSPYSDAENGVQLSFTNVIVLKTNVGTMADGEHLAITTTGSGDGYFCCGGKYAPITWSREDGGQFTYTYADGSNVDFGRGKTYIAIIPDSSEVDFS